MGRHIYRHPDYDPQQHECIARVGPFSEEDMEHAPGAVIFLASQESCVHEILVKNVKEILAEYEQGIRTPPDGLEHELDAVREWIKGRNDDDWLTYWMF